MAYSELIKNFNVIRDYMRDFYVYGFKQRDDYTRKSARSYDNEKRRMESWLKDFMRFRESKNGKQVFIQVDSRSTKHNPLFNAWKAKSFTDRSITLHFLLFDILHNPEISLTLNEILDELNDYLSEFDELITFDKSTVRKKLNQYEAQGLVIKKKVKRVSYYSRAKDCCDIPYDLLHFFSEISPCGVIGSFINDRATVSHETFKNTEISEKSTLSRTILPKDIFTFKHHFITGTLDSEILYKILLALRNQAKVEVKLCPHRKKTTSTTTIVPLRIMISAVNGREYVMAHNEEYNSISAYRLDSITEVKELDICPEFSKLKQRLDSMSKHIFGISTKSYSKKLEDIEFTVYFADDEQFIPERLEREKRCGNISYIDDNHCKFSATVYDARELFPWIRTFICRLVDLKISNKKLEEIFFADLQKLYDMYDVSTNTDSSKTLISVLKSKGGDS